MKTYLSWLGSLAEDDSVDFTHQAQQLSETPLSQGLLLAFVGALGKRQALAG